MSGGDKMNYKYKNISIEVKRVANKYFVLIYKNGSAIYHNTFSSSIKANKHFIQLVERLTF